MLMNKLTTTHKINVVGLILVPSVIAAGYWYFNNAATPLVMQEANENSSSTITQIATVNQVANFTLKDKKMFFRDSEHQAALTFLLDGQIIPTNTCFNVETDAQILELNFEGFAQVTKNDVRNGIICITSPRSEMLLWAKFDREPARLDGTATNP